MMIGDLKVYLVTAWNSTDQSFTFKVKRPILHLPSMTLFLEETNQSQYNIGKEIIKPFSNGQGFVLTEIAIKGMNSSFQSTGPQSAPLPKY